MPFVRKHIELFVQSKGKVNLNPNLQVKKDIQPEVVQKMNEKEYSEMTPQEQLRHKKELRARAEFEQLRKAAVEAHLGNSIGKELEMNQFHNKTSGSTILSNTQRKNVQAAGTIK